MNGRYAPGPDRSTRRHRRRPRVERKSPFLIIHIEYDPTVQNHLAFQNKSVAYSVVSSNLIQELESKIGAGITEIREEHPVANLLSAPIQAPVFLPFRLNRSRAGLTLIATA